MVVTCTHPSKVSSSVIPPIMATVDGSGKKYQGLSKSWTELKKNQHNRRFKEHRHNLKVYRKKIP